MAKSREVTIRGRLKAAIRSGSGSAVKALSNLRSSTVASDYPMIVRSFKLVAPLEFANLTRLGPRKFGQLVWLYPPLAPTSLGNELAWASAWLKGQSSKINDYRCFANELQELVLAGDMDNASTKLDAFCSTKGWSLWAVELRLALEQQAKGTDAQKSLAAAWQSTAANKMVSLITQIVSDRNDATYSFDAFTWKCRNSFSRFTKQTWLPSYLWYRSFSYVDNPEESVPIILSRELSSCLIDYYEAVIRTLQIIALNTEVLSYLKSSAIRLIDSLVKDGYSDHRLQNFRVALTGIVTLGINGISESNSSLNQLIFAACTARLRWNDVPSDLSPFLQCALTDIRQCEEEGNQAQEAITRLNKLGVNFKGLDFGITIGGASLYQTSDITTGTILPLTVTLATHDWKLEYAAALDEETIRKLLVLLAQDNCCSMSVQAKGFLSVLDGQSVVGLKIEGSSLFLWIGRQLVIQKRYDEVLWLCDRLAEFGSFWYRQSKKIQLSAFINEEKLRNALELIVQWLLKNSSYAYEFPISKLFIDRKWLDFAELDTALVGLISHHAYIATNDQNIHYICKKACLSIALKGGREFITGQFESTSDETVHDCLLAFMRDVWIEENLSLNYLLESTADVQNERMQVMQILIQWDESNAADYVNVIKELTFDQTLRNGLRQINQTRVFVNEVALYRWAEKELYQDYERWTKLLESKLNIALDDDLVRQYLFDPSNLSLLQALGRDTPTEADALLIQILERLFERFLYDPSEGLDCYLSLRIRHGSLRGTLLGALEEQGLLYSSTGFSQTAFDRHWGSSLELSETEYSDVLVALKKLTSELKNICDELINDRVQIISLEKPKGAIPAKISPEAVHLFAVSLTNDKPSFQSLVFTGFFIFWAFIEPFLAAIGSYIRQDFKSQIQIEFDSLLTELRDIGQHSIPLITTLRAVATTTQSQCDTIADWFNPPLSSHWG